MVKLRYHSLLELINVFKPQSIVEIGTWNGENAIRMIETAQQYHDRVDYIGYDLFEDANEQTDAEEFNVKMHFSMSAVEAAIKRACPAAEVHLIKGNTRETLRSIAADFVFIDGGHSLETIRHDYEAVKHSKVIVFDDYYRPDRNGNMIDITKMGCNLIVADLPHAVIEGDDAVRLVKDGPQHGCNGLAVVFGVAA